MELAHVLDVTIGARLERYAIAETPNSAEVAIRGAAAHLVSPGELVIIAAYQTVADEDRAAHARTSSRSTARPGSRSR